MRATFLLGLAVAGSMFGATVYEVTGPAGVDWNANSTQILDASWTQTGSFTNVSVSALLVGEGTATAFLTNQVGAGTTAGNVIASTTVPYGALSLTQLFSGLSLGPGTYFLIIGGTDGGAWPEAAPPSVTTGTGVSANGYGFCATNDGTCDLAFPPDSTFGAFPLNSQLLVTGDVAGVPEPATAAMAATALLALAGFRKFRQRSRRLASRAQR